MPSQNIWADLLDVHMPKAQSSRFVCLKNPWQGDVVGMVMLVASPLPAWQRALRRMAIRRYIHFGVTEVTNALIILMSIVLIAKQSSVA
jgi:hypothetical protein